MTLLPGWTWAAVTVALAAAAGLGGYRMAADRGEARRMQCERNRAEEARLAAAQAAALLRRSQQAEARAAAQLADARAAYDRKLKETRNEIARLATGRECLAPALRLRLEAAIADPDGLPEGARDAARPAAEPAADPGDGRAATDADVARWALDVARAYEECRARIDAIGRWDAMTHGGGDGG